MKYSIDTSALIEGWHRLWPPDIVAPFWDNLDRLIHAGDLRATEEVLKELEKKDDAVWAWAKQRQSRLLVPIDDRIQVAVKALLANHQRLVDTRKNKSGADPWVIALAQIENATVITEESFTGNIAKPRIPDVCAALEIPCVNLLGLIRQEGWQVLQMR